MTVAVVILGVCLLAAITSAAAGWYSYGSEARARRGDAMAIGELTAQRNAAIRERDQAMKDRDTYQRIAAVNATAAAATDNERIADAALEADAADDPVALARARRGQLPPDSPDPSVPDVPTPAASSDR